MIVTIVNAAIAPTMMMKMIVGNFMIENMKYAQNP
jgi:hypothetical protein